VGVFDDHSFMRLICPCRQSISEYFYKLFMPNRVCAYNLTGC
jgi:hypothetical protein